MRWQYTPYVLPLLIAAAILVALSLYVWRRRTVPGAMAFVRSPHLYRQQWSLFRFRLLDIVPVARSTVVNDMSDGVMVLDPQNRIVDLNLAAQRIIGPAASDAIGRPAAQVLADYPALVERCCDVTEGHAEVILGREKTQRHYDLRISPLTDQRGHLIGRLVVLHDITARKRLQERLEAIYQLGQELTLLYDEATIVQRALEAVADVFQFEMTACGLVDETANELEYRYVVGDVPQMLGRRLPLEGELSIGVAVVRSGQAINVPDTTQDTRYVSRDWPGRSELCVPMKVGDRIIGVLNAESVEPNHFSPDDQQLLQTLADQTAVALENARLYEEIRQRVDELATLNRISQVVTSTLDLQETLTIITDHTTRLLDVAVASVVLYDEANDDLWFAVASGENSDFVRGKRLLLGQGIAGWVAQYGEPAMVPDVSKDPRFFSDFDRGSGFTTLSILCVPLQTKGRTIGVIEVMNKESGPFGQKDLRLLTLLAAPAAVAIENARLHENLRAQLDTLQEAQARLVQSEKLAAVGELIAGVAHELNNPLTSILGFARLLQHSDVDDETRRDLDKIVAQSQRAAGIVRGLLNFARQRPPERRPVQINDVLGGTLDLLAYELRTHNVDWTTQLFPDLPLTMADTHQLQQVFVNLVHNARQAMSVAHSSGGHLKITTELGPSIFINHQAGTAMVIRVTIQDDGPGIQPDVLRRIFDPFFTTKSPREGTGLGLSVCHGIVSEHGGHIWAESESGRGSTFFVELPVVAPESPRRAGAQEWVSLRRAVQGKAASAGAARILVIDDEVELLGVLARVLQREGYQVDAVSDGETALARLAETRYDLIMCDVRMPGISGPEVYQQVQAQDPDLARRIIFTTGDTMSPTTRFFLEETGASYLGKPFDLDDLIEKVRTATAKGVENGA